MNYLRLLSIPLLASLALALAGCPEDDEDDTTVSISETPGSSSTTVIEDSDTPPATDTDVDIDVDTTPPPTTTEYVVVEETVRQEHPQVVTVVERQYAALNAHDPAQLETVFIADAPARETYVTEVVTDFEATPVYRVETFNVQDASDTELTAEVVSVVLPSGTPTNTATVVDARRQTALYTFRPSDTGEWMLWDINVTNTTPLTADEVAALGGGTIVIEGGANGDAGMNNDAGGDTGM